MRWVYLPSVLTAWVIFWFTVLIGTTAGGFILIGFYLSRWCFVLPQRLRSRRGFWSQPPDEDTIFEWIAGEGDD